MNLPEPLINQLEAYRAAFWANLPQFIAALFFLLLTWLIVKTARYAIATLMPRARMRRSLIEVFQMLVSALIWFSGLLVAVTIAFPSITPAKALTALGLGSVAIGFAFKDIFENFLAGVLVLIREPFRLGDFIECQDIEGEVTHITMRDTRIRKTDGQIVVMPNGMLLKNPVKVLTHGELRRTTVMCGVAYGEDVDKAREVITKAVREVDTVRNDVRDVQIFAHGFGDSSVDFEVTWWTGSRPIDIRQSRDQVVSTVKRALDDAGIEIPFPYRTLTFKEQLTVHNKNSDERSSGDA